ncbi:MAG: zinc ribbon domain-containing protein [Trichodesmium sp. MO_231.B1]|nr:zinc ribbon domain-containing protein [Trichodesmium sp. MO_231.B1]
MAIPPYIRIIHHTYCSNCGQKVPKTLSVRIHFCPKCGTVLYHFSKRMLYPIGWGSVGPTPNPSGGGEV